MFHIISRYWRSWGNGRARTLIHPSKGVLFSVVSKASVIPVSSLEYPWNSWTKFLWHCSNFISSLKTSYKHPTSSDTSENGLVSELFFELERILQITSFYRWRNWSLWDFDAFPPSHQRLVTAVALALPYYLFCSQHRTVAPWASTAVRAWGRHRERSMCPSYLPHCLALYISDF